MTIFPSGAAPARAGRSSSAANTSATRHAVMIVVLPRGAARSIEGRHGFAGAPRALGGLGGHFGAPHQVVYAENRTVCARDRKSTRLNSSHITISYAVLC